MQIETLAAMNEDLQANLMRMLEVVVLITVLFVIAALVIYLAGIAWFCLQEKRQRKMASQRAGRAASPNIWKSAPGVPNTYGRALHYKQYLYHAED